MDKKDKREFEEEIEEAVYDYVYKFFDWRYDIVKEEK